VDPATANLTTRLLLSSFDNFHQTPALVLAQRAGFHDAHDVADVAAVLFVVGEEFLGALHEFPVDRVHQTALDHDGDRLVHFGGHYYARFLLAKVSIFHFELEISIV
jgi:hypothetical protein